MKVRWREHEMILVTIAMLIAIAGYLWQMYSPTAAQIGAYGTPFLNNKTTFSYFANIFLLQAGPLLLLYLAYLWINRFTIPPLTHSSKEWLKKYLWAILQVLIIAYLLGPLANMISHSLNPYRFTYAESTFFPFIGAHPQPFTDLTGGLGMIIAIMIAFAVYIILREMIIYFIERSQSTTSYRVLIANQCTLFMAVYFSIYFLFKAFGLTGSYPFIVAYFSLIPPAFLVFMMNTHWLFRLKQERTFLHPAVLLRQLLLPLACTFPFAFIPGAKEALAILFLSWSVQILIVTPISWLVYQQRKDQLQQLRGMEKELVKSNASLQFLRSQINPHFLFNALNTLYGTALQEGSERTAEGIQKLGDMMRFMLHENNHDFIPMSREIDYLTNYISLQKLRTQSSPLISITDKITPTHSSYQIAPMLLIPLVENAFKHGISMKEKSWIDINLTCDEKGIYFSVRNSIHPLIENDPEYEKSGTGLNNVMERLKLLYPGRHEFNTSYNNDEFVATMAIRP